MSPRTRDIKERINKWDLIKKTNQTKKKKNTQKKPFCMAKEIIDKMKRKPTVWENIFANDTLDKGLISKMYKELTQLHTRNTSNPI